MTKVSAVTTYQEALSQLVDAVNALDQAHALLKDIDLDNYISTRIRGSHLNMRDTVAIADRLLFDLQNVRCPDCDKPMADSEDCLSGCCPEVR